MKKYICALLACIAFSGTLALPVAGYTASAQSLERTFEDALDPIGDRTDLTKVFEDTQDPNAPEGISEVSGLVNAITQYWRIVVGAFAGLMIVIAAVRMITAFDEETINQNKRLIMWSMVGLGGILLADVFVTDILFGREFAIGGPDAGGGGVFNDGNTIEGGAFRFAEEVFGVINYVTTALSAIAVAMIIVSAGQLLLNFGNEEKLSQQKSVFVSIAFGLVMIAFNQIAVAVFYNPQRVGDLDTVIVADAALGIAEIVGFIQFGLGFLALIATVLLLYGGFLMVSNYGNEDMVSKAKNIIRDVIIGLILIFSAYAVTATMIIADSP